jgi:peptide/nickel transport system permease protein
MDNSLEPSQATIAQPTVRKRSGWQRIFALRHNLTVVIGACILIFWVTMAIIGPAIVPYGINEISSGQVWKPPSAAHAFGTDNLGRDIFTRVMIGARQMVILPVLSISLAVVIGASIGLLSGYRGGWVDEVIMRIMDAIMAFPVLMLYLMIIAAVGASVVNVIIAVAVATAPGISRLVRGLVLDLRSREFIAAARMRGEPTSYILFREILPNTINPIIVDALVRIGYASFSISALGFLGLGVPPPNPDWGAMVSEARNALIITPTAPLIPALAIASLVIGFNLLADGLSEVTRTDR